MKGYLFYAAFSSRVFTTSSFFSMMFGSSFISMRVIHIRSKKMADAFLYASAVSSPRRAKPPPQTAPIFMGFRGYFLYCPILSAYFWCV